MMLPFACGHFFTLADTLVSEGMQLKTIPLLRNLLKPGWVIGFQLSDS